jgi:hypothetical protein
VSSAALEVSTRSAASAKGVWISLFNIPRIAKSLMPVDNERKHGGVEVGTLLIDGNAMCCGEEERKSRPTSRISGGRNVVIDYYIYRFKRR